MADVAVDGWMAGCFDCVGGLGCILWGGWVVFWRGVRGAFFSFCVCVFFVFFTFVFVFEFVLFSFFCFLFYFFASSGLG